MQAKNTKVFRRSNVHAWWVEFVAKSSHEKDMVMQIKYCFLRKMHKTIIPPPSLIISMSH